MYIVSHTCIHTYTHNAQSLLLEGWFYLLHSKCASSLSPSFLRLPPAERLVLNLVLVYVLMYKMQQGHGPPFSKTVQGLGPSFHVQPLPHLHLTCGSAQGQEQ